MSRTDARDKIPSEWSILELLRKVFCVVIHMTFGHPEYEMWPSRNTSISWSCPGFPHDRWQHRTVTKYRGCWVEKFSARANTTIPWNYSNKIDFLYFSTLSTWQLESAADVAPPAARRTAPAHPRQQRNNIMCNAIVVSYNDPCRGGDAGDKIVYL